MEGFDPRFRDLPDYILKITKEIWEDRGLATLRQYYGDDIVVRAPGAIVRGNEGVIAATMATLAEFPDRTLLGEDVIWSGDDQAGFLSSHRILSTATHLGDGMFGPATGRRLRYRIIADCFARNNQITDEWIVRDQGAVVRQMGIEPKRYAAKRIAAEGGPKSCPQPMAPDNDPAGPYLGAGNDDPWGSRYADILSRLMAADLASIRTVYDRAAQLELPGGITAHGWEAADGFWMRLRSALPSAEFRVHHRIGREYPLMPRRAALEPVGPP
ncbi:MAG: nuclear transport factor 2 family protein [Acetobacteraceae bacterium]|nr:nuclear transport factor 2 family protein [Acetobacteraceae bacterium]